MDWIKAAVLGIVEGLTEFIPVSSTGHLIVAARLLRFEGPATKSFEIFIQLGAILAVVILYKERFYELLNFKRNRGFKGRNGIALLALTTIPALLLGFVFHDFIKTRLFNSATVAIGLAVGGIGILLAEAFLPKTKTTGLDNITWKEALLIGGFQCLSLWPGMSRSASTILGAMLIGVERKTAAEYSFFAAVPVFCAAAGYDLSKNYRLLDASDAGIFAVGFIVSFFAAWLSLKYFIRFLSRAKLTVFGWYRLLVSPFIYFGM